LYTVNESDHWPLLVYALLAMSVIATYIVSSELPPSTIMFMASLAAVLASWLTIYGLGSRSLVNPGRLSAKMCNLSNILVIVMFVSLAILLGQATSLVQALY
jgi:hypothetical protein